MTLLGPEYDESDLDALQGEVLPKYLSFFNTLAIERLILAPTAAVMTCGPLASSVVDAIAQRLPNAVIHGYEPSRAAANAASDRTNAACSFRALTDLPTDLPDGACTHAVIVHPLSDAPHKLQLMREASRVLVPAGQLLWTLPLRGSYPEIADMMREFSLKHDNPKFGEAIEIASQSRPTPETLTEDLERLGFDDVVVDVELLSVPFDTGRDFTSHPLFRLVVAPELSSLLGGSAEVVAAALEYTKLAIGKYWSEGQFDLTVNLGCASARKP